MTEKWFATVEHCGRTGDVKLSILTIAVIFLKTENHTWTSITFYKQPLVSNIELIFAHCKLKHNALVWHVVNITNAVHQ